MSHIQSSLASAWMVLSVSSCGGNAAGTSPDSGKPPDDASIDVFGGSGGANPDGGPAASGGGAVADAGTDGAVEAVCGLSISICCDECLTTQCFTECAATTAEPGLDAYIACSNGCEDLECAAACESQFPKVVERFRVLDECLEDKCATECCCCVCGLTTGDVECDQCFQINCSQPCLYYQEHEQAYDYLDCLGACVDDSCISECDAQYPNMATLREAFEGCVAAECADECAFLFE